MEYSKINSLWKREAWYFDEKDKKDKSKQNGRQSFIVGDYAREEFGNIKTWDVCEKIDGTNIRIFYKDGKVIFGGRTKDAQLPCHLLEYLQRHFIPDVLSLAFPTNENRLPPNVILFGEGYGPKIQAAGGNYRKDPGFILFDVFIGGFWLKHDDLREISQRLEIPMVPHIGRMTTEEVVEFVKSKPLSRCSMNPQMMEGVVCRPSPPMLFRNGENILMKLKCKEF